MAVSNASFSGPTKAEYGLQSSKMLREGLDSLGDAFVDARKFQEAKRQFNVQRASQDLAKYVEAQGGDYAYASQRNPSMFQEYARIAFPDVNPDEFVKGLQDGAQTYIQGIQAQMAEIGRGNVNPKMGTNPEEDVQKVTVPGQPAPAAPAAPAPGKPAPAPAPAEKPAETTYKVMDANVPGERKVDWDKLKSAFKEKGSGYPAVYEMGGGALSPSGLTEEPYNNKFADVINTPEYKAVEEMVRKQGITPEQAIASLSEAQVQIRSSMEATAGMRIPQEQVPPSKSAPVTEGKAGVSSVSPEEEQSYNVAYNRVAANLPQGAGVPEIIAAVDSFLTTQLGVKPGDIVRQSELGKRKMTDDQGKLANLRLSLIEDIKNRNQRGIRTGGEWTVDGFVPWQGGNASAPQNQEAAKVAEDVDKKAGTTITKYLYQGKDIADFTPKDKADFARQLDIATRGAIQEFRVNEKLDPGSREEKVASRYAKMSNALLELGLDLPQNHPVMREVMQFSRDIEEGNKRADTQLKLAQAALYNSQRMTPKQAQDALDLKSREIDAEEAKTTLEREKHYGDVLRTHLDALDKAVEAHQKDQIATGRKVTNSFADAYKYNPSVKQIWSNIQNLYKQLKIETPQITDDLTYSSLKSYLFGFLELPSDQKVTISTSGNMTGAPGTDQEQAQIPVDPRVDSVSERYK